MERVKITKKLLKKIEAEVKLKFKNQASEKHWNETIEKNKEGFLGQEVCDYATRWGKAMQYLIENKEYEFVDAAVATQEACDVDDIMSGFTMSCAVKMLSKDWAYGDSLGFLHKSSFIKKEDIEVNPAMLS